MIESFEVSRPKQKPIVVIRTASAHELSDYEKRKLANIEENAQENVIETISVNNKSLYVDPINKQVNIDLEDYAIKGDIKCEDLSDKDLFHISCVVDENDPGFESPNNPVEVLSIRLEEVE